MLKKIAGLIVLIAVGEAAYLGFELIRHWMEINWASEVKLAHRTAAVERVEQQMEIKRIFLGKRVEAPSLPYYGFKLSDHIFDGGNFDFETAVTWDAQALRSGLHQLDEGASIAPYFHRYDGKEANSLFGIPLPGSHEAKHHEIATAQDPETKAEYAVASLDQHLILVPIEEYTHAGLPLQENSGQSLPVRRY